MREKDLIGTIRERTGLDSRVAAGGAGTATMRTLGEQTGAGGGVVERHVRAVFETFAEGPNPGEWRDVRRQLPVEYDPLYEARAGGADA